MVFFFLHILNLYFIQNPLYKCEQLYCSYNFPGSCMTFYKPDKQLLDIGLVILRNLELIAEGKRDLRLS